MKPYYEHAGITIYHGDCREILPTLSSVDLIVTDPPYGVRRPSAWRSAPERFAEVAGNLEISVAWITAAFAAMREGSAIYVATVWDVMETWRLALAAHFNVRSCIVWDKTIHGLADLETCWAPTYEMFLFAAKGRHVLRSPRPVDLVRAKRVDPALLQSPYEKPVPLMGKFIRHSSDRGATVLDPFAGSGTTLVAAKDLGRSAIGIEIEERYCEIAVRRLSQEVLPLTGRA